MPVRIDTSTLTTMLDSRIATVLPSEWPTTGWAFHARSSTVGSHLQFESSIQALPLDEALDLVVENINEAIYQYSDGVSEDAHEPYAGEVEIDGELLRVRFGRVPRVSPDDTSVAPELEPILLSSILTITPKA